MCSSNGKKPSEAHCWDPEVFFKLLPRLLPEARGRAEGKTASHAAQEILANR